MASRSVSPGGALLRSSRVFSLPPPLPKPATNLSSTAIFGSDTATLHHPIHQSITTPQSSLARGDWGFKRPLPLRSTTRTSTPIIRVESIDTFEHVTEFGSASDHSLTLKKWQEMGIPITTPLAKKQEARITNFDTLLENTVPTPSVFEDRFDSTVHQERALLDKDDTRWKFKGPWLAGLTEGEFTAYVQSQIRGRKHEFREYLRTVCAEDETKDRRRLAWEEGEVVEDVKASEITDAKLDAYTKHLRGELHTLYNLIRKFLDLPPAPNRSILKDLERISIWDPSQKPIHIKSQDYSDSDSPYADTGPPKTHPSAGIGYTRSSAYLTNHPIYGPQKHKPPVQARVLMPRGAATGAFGAVLGVGGFAVDVPRNEPSFNVRGLKGKFKRAEQAGLLNIEPDKVGGSKFWVQPLSASIDPKGSIKLRVASADTEAVAVKEGKPYEAPNLRLRNEAMSSLTMALRHTGRSRLPAKSDSGYGIESEFDK